MGNEQSGVKGSKVQKRASQKYSADSQSTSNRTTEEDSNSTRKPPMVSPRVKAAAAAASRRQNSPKSAKTTNAPVQVDSTSNTAESNKSATIKDENTAATARVRKYHKVNVGQRNIFEVDVRYQNLQNIASGAYGTVCSADDTITGESVAIKKIAAVFDDLVDAKRILREVKLLRHLANHHNIIQLRDVMTSPPNSQDFNDLYLVFDRYECDLDRLISMGQELSDAHNKYFLYQMLKGLKFIHSAGVMHRDLKPANILINSNCDLVICDFGLARGKVDTNQTEYVVTRYVDIC